MQRVDRASPVLDDQGLVEAELMADLVHLRLGGVKPGQGARRVTGDDDRQAEDDDRDDQQERWKCEQPPADVCRHRALPISPTQR